MTVHTVVYVVLCLLSVATCYAAGAPMTKSTQEQVEPAREDKDTHQSL